MRPVSRADSPDPRPLEGLRGSGHGRFRPPGHLRQRPAGKLSPPVVDGLQCAALRIHLLGGPSPRPAEDREHDPQTRSSVKRGKLVEKGGRDLRKPRRRDAQRQLVVVAPATAIYAGPSNRFQLGKPVARALA